MRRELRRVRQRLPRFAHIIFGSLMWTVIGVPGVYAQNEFSGKRDITNIPYENRLRFYLDQQSQDFLDDMAAREKLLLQMIQNISAELKARGVSAILSDAPNFKALYRDIDGLISEYGAELDQVKQLLTELYDLEDVMKKERRYGMADAFEAVKDSLIQIIDDRNLYRKLPATSGHVSNLMREYQFELDAFERLFKSLETMEKEARRGQDAGLAEKIVLQKQKLIRYVESQKAAGADSVLQKVADTYFVEIKNVISLLDELEKIEKRAVSENSDVMTDAEMLRRDMIAHLDARVLKLFGYNNYVNLKGPGVSEMFQDWRKSRLADYEATQAKYKVMKIALLKQGTAKQRNRMFERDLTDALLNYADESLLLAERQFDALLDDYADYTSNFAAVYFYRAEAKYARLFFEEAYSDYESLLSRFPETNFRYDAYLRLLTIAQTLGWRDKFYDRYREFSAISDSASTDIRNRLNYLAGYYFLQLKDLKSSEEALSKIEKGTRYYYPGLYLNALALANRGAYTGAIRVFEMLAESQSLPWSDPKLAVIRNNALLKLGYIYYDRGDYATAVSYFNRVSRGIENRDNVLIGIAWAKMKEGEYEEAISDINELLRFYLSSNYTYEALVLAAHCQRLMNQPEEALKNLRYVTTARGVLDLANEFNQERRDLLHQLDELESMEKDVLEMRDRQLFEVISGLKQNLQHQLVSLGREGGVGSNLLGEYQAERQTVYRQVQELDKIIARAKQSDNEAVAKEALRRRERLMKALATYQPEDNLERLSYFIKYPLATRESSNKFRAQIMHGLLRDMELEKQRIENALQEAHRLLADAGNEQSAVDLMALDQDLKTLRAKMDRFQTWVSTSDIEEVNTDFDHWADFSGFGMSDITVQQLANRETQISNYSDNLASIDALMKFRKQELESRLTNFDNEIDNIRIELEDEQLRLRKLEHEKLFENFYFDNSTSERPSTGKKRAPALDMP